MTQEGTGELGEEALDQVEPGAVFGCESEREAASRLSGKPSRRFLRDMGRMIVEDQLDRSIGRIGGVEKLQELDELAAAMAILDQGMDPGLFNALDAVSGGRGAPEARGEIFPLFRANLL